MSRCIVIIRFAEELTIDGDEEIELLTNPPKETVLLIFKARSTACEWNDESENEEDRKLL